MVAVRRPVTPPRWPDAVTDRPPNVVDASAADDAVESERAVYRRQIVEVDPRRDRPHRHAHVSQVHINNDLAYEFIALYLHGHGETARRCIIRKRFIFRIKIPYTILLSKADSNISQV